MHKLKLDLTLLSVQAFDTMPGLAASDLQGTDDRGCDASGRRCHHGESYASAECGAVFAHQNDTMPDKDPGAPDRKTQKEQQRDPGLQSYKSGGEGGPASDPEQNLIIENEPRYNKPTNNPGYKAPREE